MTCECRFNIKRQNNRINIDWKMSRHGCGEAAASRRPDLETERVAKKERNRGDGREQKAGGHHSSVSYIS